MRIRETAAKLCLITAAAALLSSVFFPYWWVRVKAPQYPKGLTVAVYLNRVEGDVREIDGLNHYIGMRSLKEGAPIERRLSFFVVGGMALLLIAAAFWHGRFWVLLLLPAVFFPVVFAADLFLWLRDFGLNLDPHAPFSSSVRPFVPPLLGEGKIAQFHAMADFSWGHGLSMLAMILCLAVIPLRFFKHKSLALILILFLAGSSGASAQTLTVGGDGAFSTIQDALGQTEAGDTVIVRKGIYQGPIVIDRSVTLEGEGGPVIDGGGKGTVVSIKAPDVVFRGFIVRNSGDLLAAENAGLLAAGERPLIENNRFEDVLFGVYLSRAAGGVLKGNRFTGKALDTSRRGDLIRVWYSDRVRIENNRTERGRDVVLWYSKNLVVRGNEFTHGRYGLHFMYCKDADVEANRLIGNSVGAYLMYSEGLRLSGNTVSDNRGPSGFGIGFKDMRNALIERNVIVSNRVGMYLDGCEGMVCRMNTIAHNNIGFNLLPTAARNAFEKNNVIDNAEQTLLDGASVQTVNDWAGNYWSDYRGFDADRDGAGDVPYRPMRLFERLTDRFHDLRVFFGSPAVQAIDFAAAAFPVFAPTPKFEDPRPLMRPAPPPVWPSLTADPRSGSLQTGGGVGWGALSLLFLLPLAGLLMKETGPARLPLSSAARPAGGPFTPVIRIQGVSKRYKKVRALSNVDLEVRRGEAVALWGPNGAGKTTLLKCILGIVRFEGSIQVAGFDVKRRGRETRSLIGYVPQEIRLHQDQTVWETVSFYARLRGVARERVERLLSEWGLAVSRNQMAQNLSGGMKQKLALIIALLADPPILLLDEPTSNLDEDARGEFSRILGLLKFSGKTLLFCTHMASELKESADRVIYLEGGMVRKPS